MKTTIRFLSPITNLDEREDIQNTLHNSAYDHGLDLGNGETFPGPNEYWEWVNLPLSGSDENFEKWLAALQDGDNDEIRIMAKITVDKIGDTTYIIQDGWNPDKK